MSRSSVSGLEVGANRATGTPRRSTEELAEVPAHVADGREPGVDRGLEELPQRLGRGAVHVALGHDPELGALPRRELLDLLVRARLLAAELVAGERQNREALRAVLLV